MPLTQEKYIIKENPALVAWERETRRFLRNLSLAHGHRVASVMVYEWATGITVKDALESTEENGPQTRVKADLRHINTVLRSYFGDSFTTHIANRKVRNCYKVPVGHRVKRRRPVTTALWVEWAEKGLDE